MKSFTTTTALAAMLLLAFCRSTLAFSTQPQNNILSRPVSSKTSLHMSDEPLQNQKIGAAERLLLERKRIQDEGLVQELGRTVKKDGLDGLRALIWGMYDAYNVVFPVLAVFMFTGICVNLAGYGYYWDNDTNKMVFDTLEHIRQENVYQAELLRIAAQTGVTMME